MSEEMEKNESKYVRKTVDLVRSDEIIHNSFDTRNKPILGYIIENENYKVFENKSDSLLLTPDGKNGPMVYLASFFVSDQPKDNETGKFPADARRYCIKASSLKPFDLSEYRNGEKPMYISGQRFETTSEKTGKTRVILFPRSLSKAERQRDGIFRGVASIISKDDAIKQEYNFANTEILAGYVYQGQYSQFNKPLINKDGLVSAYAQRFTVCAERWDKEEPVLDKNGKRVYDLKSVEMMTKEPIEFEKLLSFKDGEKHRLTMKGATRVYDYKNKNNELVKDTKVFEPSWIGCYEKNVSKTAERAPKGKGEENEL